MPIYEYECPKCGRFEHFQTPSEKGLTKCPTCKEKGKQSKVKRLLSASAFHLKGTGWYQSDYKGSGSGGASKAESAEGSKPEAKTEPKKGGAKKTEGAKACGSGCGCH